MASDPIPALTLIATAVREIAAAVRRARGVSKQRLLRHIASLFGIFERVDEQIEGINSNLQAFIEEEQVGMRVHYIHEAGIHFRRFLEVQDEFFEWMEESEKMKMIDVIALFSHATEEMLDRLARTHYDARRHVSTGIDTIRSELQAVESPNPAAFPAPATVTEVIKQLAGLGAEILYAKKIIRAFVCANFTIEDMFS